MIKEITNLKEKLEVNSSLKENNLVINGFYDFTKEELEEIEKTKNFKKISFDSSLRITIIEFKKAV